MHTTAIHTYTLQSVNGIAWKMSPCIILYMMLIICVFQDLPC